ncbi:MULTISPECIES: hypothetical protein [unclassified Desulfovibrio]|uniref:hypothetical protein n=1 Tax=unclassified Desulfovibrio TaxID=2593640 RepID=UPI002FDAE73D
MTKYRMPKLTLILAVHNGGKSFQECLESIIPHLHCIDSLFVSINKGSAQEDDVVTWKNFLQQQPDVQHTCLIQKKFLSAKQHAAIIYPKLLETYKGMEDIYYLILCHDDMLMPNFSETVKDILPKLNAQTTVNPARAFYKDTFSKENHTFTFYGLLAHQDGISRENFISADIDRNYITNISGIILHRTVYENAMKWCLRTVYGYRSEYLLLASKGVKKIMGTQEPLVGIRLHSASGSSLAPTWKIRIDEYIYLLYMYFTTNDPFLREKLRRRCTIVGLAANPVKELAFQFYKRVLKKILPKHVLTLLKSRLQQWR